MVGCCVVGCGRNSSKPTVDTRYRNNARNVTFHQFPADLQIRSKWINAVIVGGRVEEWEPGTNTKICSLHFNVKDIKYNEKGTQILKGAVPNIPRAAKKKPPRRNKAAIVRAYKNLVEDICSDEGVVMEEIISEPEKVVEKESLEGLVEYDISQNLLEAFQIDLFNPDMPGTSSDYSFPSSPDLMEVEEVIQADQQNAKTKKVVKAANVHVFEAPDNSSEVAAGSDPCISLYGELLGKMKEFNIAVAKHHPSKSEDMQKVLDDFSKLFIGDRVRENSSATLLHQNDPFMPAHTEGEKGNVLFDLDSEELFYPILENPEKYLEGCE